MTPGEREQARRSLWDFYDAVVAATPVPQTPTTRAEWEALAEPLRARIMDALGVVPPDPAPARMERLGATDFGAYTIERVAYRTRPEFLVPANLYIPKGLTEQAPAVIAPHGHESDGKAYDRYQSLYIGLARKGFIVLAPDCVGKGERIRQGHRRLGSSLLIGTSVMGMEIWDISKGLDLLCSRDDVDPARIGCIGNSGGGTQTIWAAALDHRIAAAVVSDATTTFAYNHGKERDICFCNLAQRIVPHAEIHHVLGLVAPRPLRLVGGAQDPMFPRDLQREVLRRTKRVYALYGREDALDQVITDDPHGLSRVKREAAYAFFVRQLRDGLEETVPEPEPADVKPLPSHHPAIVCFPEPPPELLRPLDETVRQEAERLTAGWRVPVDPASWAVYRATRVARLRSLLFRRDVRLPERISRNPSNVPGCETVTLWSDAWTPMQALLAERVDAPEGALVIVDEEGKDSAWSRQQFDAARTEGRTVISVDVRGWGALAPNEAPPDDEWILVQKALGYDMPLLGLRVADVLRVIEWTRHVMNVAHIEVAGRGYGSVVALLGAILDERIAAAHLSELPRSLIPHLEEEQRRAAFTFVPSLLRDVGDVPHLIGLLSPRACQVRGFVPDTPDLRWPKECYALLGSPDAFLGLS